MEIDFHPEITIDQTILNQIIMEKKAFMLTNDPTPELYDVSHAEGIIPGESKQIQELDKKIAFFVYDKDFDNLDKMCRMLSVSADDAAVFDDKDKARSWLEENQLNAF